MATEIEANISSPKGEYLSTPEIKVDYPEDTSDILSLEDVVSLKIFIKELNEWWEPIGKQELEERVPDEGHQEFTHDSMKEGDLELENEPLICDFSLR
jgi:hypothetical protein